MLRDGVFIFIDGALRSTDGAYKDGVFMVGAFIVGAFMVGAFMVGAFNSTEGAFKDGALTFIPGISTLGIFS